MGIFKRRSTQAKLDDNKPSSITTVGVATPGTEKSYESHYDAREVLFTQKDGKTSRGLNFMSPLSGKISGLRDATLHSGYKAKRATTVPTARESAYSGPPRYDWIDVEAAAAIKIQSIYRRHQVLHQLEKKGKSTSAMRNRIRARNASEKSSTSEDVPFLFRFCGVDLLFSEETRGDNEFDIDRGETYDADVMSQKKMKAFQMRKKPTVEIEEAVEVVDDGETQDAQVKKGKSRRFQMRKKAMLK